MVPKLYLESYLQYSILHPKDPSNRKGKMGQIRQSGLEAIYNKKSIENFVGAKICGQHIFQPNIFICQKRYPANSIFLRPNT